MNIERLKELEDMYRNRKTILNPDMEVGIASCGTIGCIAGESLMRWSPPGQKFAITKEWGWAAMLNQAAEYLDLYHWQAQRLFQLDDWPLEWRRAYYRAAIRERGNVMAGRIALFIRTSGNE